MPTCEEVYEVVQKLSFPYDQKVTEFFRNKPKAYDKEVEKLQKFFRDSGFRGSDAKLLKVTGNYDIDTYIAINSFKLRSGLAEDWLKKFVVHEACNLMISEEADNQNGKSSESGTPVRHESDEKESHKDGLKIWLIKDASASRRK